jgi:hypothetical protein
MSEKKYRACQSCGMPFKSDPKGGGTEADGSRSTKYCSYCYQNGRFLQPDWTVEQMQAFVKDKMKTMPLHWLFSGMFVRGIPRLERWRGTR